MHPKNALRSAGGGEGATGGVSPPPHHTHKAIQRHGHDFSAPLLAQSWHLPAVSRSAIH